MSYLYSLLHRISKGRCDCGEGGVFMRRLLAYMIGIVSFAVIVVPVLITGVNLSKESGGNMTDLSSLESVMLNVYLHDKNKIVSMTLEEYVQGVVGAEMPAEFSEAALQAQAVAARTYAVKHMHKFGGSGVSDHPDADVSTDHTVNQAWVSDDVLKERWGKKYDEYKQKIKLAVLKTQGMILTYNDEPIHALFHSTSGDRTASAKEVWGNDYPYLQSVECKWDTASPRYKDNKTISVANLAESFGQDAVTVSAGNGDLIKILSLTDSGRVAQMKIGNKNFTGSEVRNTLGLRSENFTIESKGDEIIFHTIGYGHGVGLCQYGANGMAKEGWAYQDILKYYYKGVELKNIYGS